MSLGCSTKTIGTQAGPCGIGHIDDASVPSASNVQKKFVHSRNGVHAVALLLCSLLTISNQVEYIYKGQSVLFYCLHTNYTKRCHIKHKTSKALTTTSVRNRQTTHCHLIWLSTCVFDNSDGTYSKSCTENVTQPYQSAQAAE